MTCNEKPVLHASEEEKKYVQGLSTLSEADPGLVFDWDDDHLDGCAAAINMQGAAGAPFQVTLPASSR